MIAPLNSNQVLIPQRPWSFWLLFHSILKVQIKKVNYYNLNVFQNSDYFSDPHFSLSRIEMMLTVAAANQPFTMIKKNPKN